jgi:hypothetical protein
MGHPNGWVTALKYPVGKTCQHEIAGGFGDRDKAQEDRPGGAQNARGQHDGIAKGGPAEEEGPKAPTLEPCGSAGELRRGGREPWAGLEAGDLATDDKGHARAEGVADGGDHDQQPEGGDGGGLGGKEDEFGLEGDGCGSKEGRSEKARKARFSPHHMKKARLPAPLPCTDGKIIPLQRSFRHCPSRAVHAVGGR